MSSPKLQAEPLEQNLRKRVKFEEGQWNENGDAIIFARWHKTVLTILDLPFGNRKDFFRIPCKLSIARWRGVFNAA